MKEYYFEIVNFWLEKLVGKIDKYNIKISENQNEILIEIAIEKNLIGKIIGKNGKIITSIRNVINSLPKKANENITIKVVEK